MIFATLILDGKEIGQANLLAYPPFGYKLPVNGKDYAVIDGKIPEPEADSHVRDRAIITLGNLDETDR